MILEDDAGGLTSQLPCTKKRGAHGRLAYTQQTCSILQVKRLNDWEKSRELRRSGAASRLHMLNHSGEWSSDAIELALAHKDAVRATYHPGVHWAERLEMAAWWGDYLDTLRTGAKILPLVRNQ